MNRLTLSFLGPFQAALDHKPLTTFRSAKVQGLLIYLSLTVSQAHEREVLATMFWPDERDEVARRNLRQSLYRLRRVLGDLGSDEEGESQPFLLITRSTVQFNPASSFNLDVRDFKAAVADGQFETAVSLYRDSLLDGFYCDSLPFDAWLRAEREELHRRVLDLLNKLTTYNLTHADFQKAENLARRQLRLEPWRESGHRQLMQALALQGERTAALAQYETCRAVLEEELGIEPSAETADLARSIRELELPQPDLRSDSVRRFETPFVGRQAEYDQLVQAYRQIGDGTQIVTVLGKAGSEKPV